MTWDVDSIRIRPPTRMLLYQLSSMGSFPLPRLGSASLSPDAEEDPAFATESSKASRNETTVNLSEMQAQKKEGFSDNKNTCILDCKINKK